MGDGRTLSPRDRARLRDGADPDWPHTVGVLGRLFADTLENLPPAPARTLQHNGAGTTSTFLYATLPQALPQLVSYSLYRWENNIRAASILGVVGAGGLGQMLHFHLSLFQMREAETSGHLFCYSWSKA